MRTIEGVVPADGMGDRVICSPLSFGRFFCRSFKRSIVGAYHVSEVERIVGDVSPYGG